MAKVFAPKSPVPWQPGGKANPAAPQPDPAQGPFVVDYADAASGKATRAFWADWTDSDALSDEVEITWDKVYRWVAIRLIT